MLNNGLHLPGAQLLPVKYAAEPLIMQQRPPGTWQGKTMNVHFPIMLEKWAGVLACLCLLPHMSEYRCFVSLTADIKAVFWLQHLMVFGAVSTPSNSPAVL